MDLAEGAKQLIITMTHTDKDGRPKLVPQCDLPLTAVQAVDLLITELGVFEFSMGKLTLIEVMPGSSLEEIRARTSANFQIALRKRPGG